MNLLTYSQQSCLNRLQHASGFSMVDSTQIAVVLIATETERMGYDVPVQLMKVSHCIAFCCNYFGIDSTDEAEESP